MGDTNDGTLIEPKKADDAEPTSTSSSSSPTPPLFTLTPLVQLDLPRPGPQDKTNEEVTVDVSDEEMTECEEFSCRLVLPRHRGYLAKLRLGDGITINLTIKVLIFPTPTLKQSQILIDKPIKIETPSTGNSHNKIKGITFCTVNTQ